MKNISKFINKAKELRFNDALMNVVITEIRLKSGVLNEEMILPRSSNKGLYYNGEFYEQSAMIKDLLENMAEIDEQEIQEPEFCQLLDSLGIIDITEYERDVPKNTL